MLDGLDDQIVEGGKVVGRRRQRQPGPARNRAMTHGVEAAFAQQLGSSGDQRVLPAHSLGSHRCRHGLHAASRPKSTWLFRLKLSLYTGSRHAERDLDALPKRRPRSVSAKCQWHDGPHARDSCSRPGDDSVVGVSAAAGAAGAFALGTLRETGPSVAGPPVEMTSAGTPLAPLAPPAPLEPAPTAAPTYISGSFVSAARGGIDTNWAIARPPGQTQPLRPVIALHGKGADAAQVMAGGVEQGLAQAVDAGLPPFAVVAVDGGGGYWHKRAIG